MSLARVAIAALLTAALAAGSGAQGEGEEKKVSEDFPEAEKKSVKSDAYEAMMKEKFLACRKTGDCKPYLLEKEKANKKKDNLGLIPSKLETKPLPDKPAGAKPPASASPPGEAASLAEPLEAAGSLAGPAGGAPPAGPPPTAEQAEVRRQEAGQRRARTMTRASGAADTMRRGFFPAEEPPPGNPGGPESRAPANDEPKKAFSPAEPRTVAEMALAARAGFAATFRDQGLMVGAGPRGAPAIQRVDGAPASEADVARLQAALRADPAALTRRPDFFEILPREKFLDLKQDFAARPELRSSAFKDIGMTARERDFQWSSSCSGLSGDCNAYVGKGYRKGQDVPPEDLDAVWNAVQEEIIDSDGEFGEYSDQDRRLAAAEDLAEEKLGGVRRGAPSLASLLARMGELARGAGEGAGLLSARAVPSPAPSGGLAELSSEGAARQPEGAGAAAPGWAPSAPPPSPAPAGRRAGRSWNLAYILAAAAGAALILRALRKRR